VAWRRGSNSNGVWRGEPPPPESFDAARSRVQTIRPEVQRSSSQLLE
jgi:hypothetical protein